MLRAIEYQVDGATFTGFLADGSKDRPAPGILVAHEAPGLSEHMKERALALAEEGFVALALDLYGVHDLTLEQAHRQSAQVMTTPGLMYARANAALEALAAQACVDATRLAAIGFCLGGAAALELARHGAPIRCAIGFHPGLQRPPGSPDGAIRAKILVMIGDRDPIAPADARAAFIESMNAAGADWELHLFGGVGHSYTNAAIDARELAGFRYDAEADRRSWRMALALLHEQLTECPD
jgi:dienelactone hydrolase